MESKKCPFCGGERIDVFYRHKRGRSKRCLDCTAEARADMWSIRPVEEILADQLAKVRKQYDDLINEYSELREKIVELQKSLDEWELL